MTLRDQRGRRFACGVPRRLTALALCVFVSFAALAQTPARKAEVPERWRAALEQVSADDMRGHLSFISSDALEGRKTPSRGLDIAAEYIAAQFRRAGLEPAGDDGYFQNANWTMTGRDMSAARVSFANGGSNGGETLSLRPEQLSLGFSIAGFNFWQPDSELALDGAGVLKVSYGASAALSSLTREQVAGRVVLVQLPEFPRDDRGRAFQLLREEQSFMVRMSALGSPLVVAFDATSERGRGAGSPRLVDPEGGGRRSPLGPEPTPPLVFVHGAEGARLFNSLPAGVGTARLSAHLPAPVQTPARVRNVAGILRGSDPALRDTYVIVSGHYDHLGIREGCDASKEDCIFNGANDDGSGTVGVIELATALSRLNPRPKRSIIFMTFFGEELGLVGSRYYGRHPLVPLAKTVAQINLEQIGRTDDSEGPQVGTLAVTGFDFSDVGATLQRAGEAEGVKVYKHPTNSDAYFGRSDNQSLADAGVPAHTLSVAYEYPDYHAVGDEWAKIDFANMERVVRAVGLAALLVADDAREPRWNEQNPKAAPYVEAWKKLHGKP
ncbi:MAG: M28 family metallopeptidase [Pyrinomonadaceae bacterium]